MAPERPATLILLPVFTALEAWLASPDSEEREAVVAAVVEVGRKMGIDVREIEISTTELPPLHVVRGDGGRMRRLRVVGRPATIGRIRIAGSSTQAAALTHALELVLGLASGRAVADRAAAQLRAVEQAVRGISGILDPDPLLQLIADRVRELVGAQYAAIGIVRPDGVIERFITSGIDDETRARIGPLPRGLGLLGLIIRESRSYRIADINTHPDRHGFPPHHPPMTSFLGVPILARGSAVGRLYLTNKIGTSEFGAEDQALVETFALHAGIAIENARLHDQVRRLAIVDERDRISRDLHDSIIQAIYAQTLALDDVPELMDDDPDEARRRVDEAIEALHAVIRDIRNFIFGLRPVLLESGSLHEGLGRLASELRRSGGVDVSIATDPGESSLDALPLEVVAELLAVTREALSNVARHAHATRVAITLIGTGRGLRLEIADDGRGFDAQRASERGHHGLANMRARTELIGGRFAAESDDAGTRIIIILPPDWDGPRTR